MTTKSKQFFRQTSVILMLLALHIVSHGQVPMNTVPEPYRFSGLQSRSVTQENPTGGKGMAGKDRGNGSQRKGAPAFRDVEPGETKVLCDIEGPGMIRHIWITLDEPEKRTPEQLRNYIIRMYWDGSEFPSVEAPISDFFGTAHGRISNLMTPYITTPDGRGYNCYFPMPFSKRAKITLQNDTPNELGWIFYQVDYTLGDKVTDDMGRFHASFRRDTPQTGTDYVLLDTKGTPGVFVGAVVGIIPQGRGWWGEGEMKFYLDGDEKYPTICGTGTEDYACSGWGMVGTSLYTGVNFHIDNNPEDKEQKAMGEMISFYRFHVFDPIYFHSGLKIELQQLGAGFGKNKEEVEAYKAKIGFKGYHVNPNTDKPGKVNNDWLYDRSDDYCSTVFWYQKLQKDVLPPFPSREERTRGIGIRSWEKPFFKVNK